MIIYIFEPSDDIENTEYGLYTVVIVAKDEEQAWDILFQKHGSNKKRSLWTYDTHPIDEPGEVVACVE